MPNKLTDKEIVRALEYCVAHEDTCEECICCENRYPCVTNDPKYSLDLINRLQAENEKIKAKPRLSPNKRKNNVSQIKAEARKEFAERFKKEKSLNWLISTEDVDDLLKKMEGE